MTPEKPTPPPIEVKRDDDTRTRPLGTPRPARRWWKPWTWFRKPRGSVTIHFPPFDGGASRRAHDKARQTLIAQLKHWTSPSPPPVTVRQADRKTLIQMEWERIMRAQTDQSRSAVLSAEDHERLFVAVNDAIVKHSASLDHVCDGIAYAARLADYGIRVHPSVAGLHAAHWRSV